MLTDNEDENLDESVLLLKKTPKHTIEKAISKKSPLTKLLESSPVVTAKNVLSRFTRSKSKTSKEDYQALFNKISQKIQYDPDSFGIEGDKIVGANNKIYNGSDVSKSIKYYVNNLLGSEIEGVKPPGTDILISRLNKDNEVLQMINETINGPNQTSGGKKRKNQKGKGKTKQNVKKANGKNRKKVKTTIGKTKKSPGIKRITKRKADFFRVEKWKRPKK